MKEERIVLNEQFPFLAKVGVPYFGHYQQKTPTDRLGLHQHGSCYEICYLERGVQPYYICTGGEDEAATPYELHGGEVFISRPYQLHSTGPYFQQRGCLYWIQIDCECPTLLGQAPEGAKVLRGALASIDRHLFSVPPATAARLTEAFRLLTKADGRTLLAACSLLTLFVLEVADCCSAVDAPDEPAPDGKLSETLTFIRNNLTATGLSLDAVARHLHYSKSYTSALFKRELGVTVHEYIQRSRIDLACQLLMDHPIIDVATLLGFSSSQHFSKVFREQTGLPPSAYVRLRRHGEVSAQGPNAR